MNQKQLRTQELIARQTKALHLWPSEYLQRENPWVSSRSRWCDDVWRLDYEILSASPEVATIRWPIEPPADGKLSESEYVSLVEIMRRLAWSLLCDPGTGRSLKTTSIGSFDIGARYLLGWMARRSYASLSELGADACNEYIDDLVSYLAKTAEEEDEDGISARAAYVRIAIVSSLYNQSSALEDAGIEPIPTVPFSGKSAPKIAHGIATRAEGEIPPVPDEVALPILASAHRMLGTPAQDVLRLQDIYIKAFAAGKPGRRGRPRTSYSARLTAAAEAVSGFTFSTVPGEDRPWRSPLMSETRKKIHATEIVTFNLTPVMVLRNLIGDIRDACTIVLQSEMGPRISEVCSLKAGVNSATGLPTCVEVRRSKTGLNDLFYVRGLMSKTNDGPRLKEWLAGMRPVGSDYLPPPVVAIKILNELLAPWRELGTDENVRGNLFITFASGPGLPKSSSGVSVVKSTALAMAQRNFVMQYVDLNGLQDCSDRGEDLALWRKTKGACLRTHQWRKTFGRYVRRIDPRMLPAVAQQFGHLSLAMTEGSYPGNDPALLGDLESQRVIETATVMRDLLQGDDTRIAYGSMAKVIAEHRAELKELVENKDKHFALQNVKKFVIENDLRIWYANHGKCLIGANPLAARCHELAGTVHWLNRQPNYEQQTPTTCVGCSCFLVDHEHAWFWEKRYVDNQRAWLNAVRNGCEREFYVARERANQAAQVLRVLKVKLPETTDAA